MCGCAVSDIRSEIHHTAPTPATSANARAIQRSAMRRVKGRSLPARAVGTLRLARDRIRRREDAARSGLLARVLDPGRRGLRLALAGARVDRVVAGSAPAVGR